MKEDLNDELKQLKLKTRVFKFGYLFFIIGFYSVIVFLALQPVTFHK